MSFINLLFVMDFGDPSRELHSSIHLPQPWNPLSLT